MSEKYVLYRPSSNGETMYKCSIHMPASKGGKKTLTTQEGLAFRYNAGAAFDEAVDNGWMLKKVYVSTGRSLLPKELKDKPWKVTEGEFSYDEIVGESYP